MNRYSTNVRKQFANLNFGWVALSYVKTGSTLGKLATEYREV